MAKKNFSVNSKSNLNKIKVAVLAGGIGPEREVSLQSGRCVTGAMKDAGLNVITSDIRPDDLRILDDKSIDVFFLALHGKFGEDGQLQKIFEERGLTYTGSGPKASETAFHKMMSKKLFVEGGVVTPKAVEFDSKINADKLKGKLKKIGSKFVVKPITQGSSVGISIIDGVEEATAASESCLKEFGDCMVEEFIKGRELTVGILCGQALPLIEIRPKAKFYDYKAKYIDDSTEYLFDTINDANVVKKIQNAAMDCFNVLGCRHFSRVDFILADDNTAYALEVNTIPGFTTHSLLPKAAAKAGLPMSRLCVKIIEAALKEK